MKIVSYNIQFGLGKDGHYDLERTASEVAGADIICLQEVERHWQRSGNIDQPEKLGHYLDRYYWVFGPYFDVDASTRKPDGTIANTRRQFGNMILSKTPILSTRLFPLPKSIINDQRNMVVGMIEGIVDLENGKALRIYNAHLSAKSTNDCISQIHSIRKTIARAPTEGGAWTGISTHPLWTEDKGAPPMPEDFVLLGDFNLSPEDREYDHLVRPDENECDLIDCWTLAGHQQNEGITFPAGAENEIENGLRVDYAFVDEVLQDRVLGAWIDEAARGSDHQPYWLDLDFAPRE